jgi:hypothetical protein
LTFDQCVEPDKAQVCQIMDPINLATFRYCGHIFKALSQWVAPVMVAGNKKIWDWQASDLLAEQLVTFHITGFGDISGDDHGVNRPNFMPVVKQRVDSVNQQFIGVEHA